MAIFELKIAINEWKISCFYFWAINVMLDKLFRVLLVKVLFVRDLANRDQYFRDLLDIWSLIRQMPAIYGVFNKC